MEFELHREAAVFTRLHDEWNALVERCATQVLFLRAEYQAAWWSERGGGEWPQAELAVVTARDEAGALVGIAPLFRAANREGRPALLLVGSIEISDYLDFIVARQHAAEFCTGLLARLTAADAPEWEVLDLYNLPAASPTRAALAQAAAQRGWSASEQLLQPVPVIHLPGDWDTYLTTMVEKKERQEIRRKLRRAEGGDDKVTWYMVTGHSGQDRGRVLAEEAEAFIEMMGHNPEKAAFLTPAMRAQMRAVTLAMGRAGWLRLAFLEVNGERAAAYLMFDYANRLWIYNSAIDPRFNALSPGWVLLGYLLAWAIEHQRAAFDFLRGDEDYKFRFGAVAEKIYRLQIARALPLEALGGEAACMMNEFEADFFPPPVR
ncbi:MAG: GNAT family N-acetyltransferase [Anaerolineales bacterium]|nr:GNAT family N-acetyltransferase [Anaerolineales bacterium]